MNIALLTEGIFPKDIGGIQKHSFFLAKYLAKEKVQVDIFYSSLENKDITWTDFFSEKELEYIKFNCVNIPNIFRFPGHYLYSSYELSKRLYLILDDEKYDIIYAQGFTSWYFLKKHPFQKNLISNLHGMEMFQLPSNFKNKLQQIILKIPAKIIIKNSQHQVSLGGKLSDILYENGAKKNTVLELPNGISRTWLHKFENIEVHSNRPLRFIFIGRYERRKGIEEFQEVIEATIGGMNYDVEFIGPIPERNRIQHAAVHYLGQVQDPDFIKDKLKNADILVCPSYSEGMPTVILEAMACGCAIIATEVGAVSTMVDKKNGWLIRGDIKKGLRLAINEALELDEKEILDKKRNSIKRVMKNFTWDRITEKTLKEFSFIISN